MWSRHKAALQESTRLFTRLAPGHLHHLPFLQGKAPSSWALTRRTDFDEFHWNKFRLHASNQKRKAVFRMFYLLFDDLHHMVLQSHHLFRPERSFDKAPYCKALVHFHFLQKKKCSLEKLGKEVEECNIFPVQPGILTGSSIKPESSSSFTLSQLRCYPSQCSRDMEHNTLGSSQVKGDFSDCCFSFYYVPPTSTSSKRKTTKIFINPSLLSTHNIA